MFLPEYSAYAESMKEKRLFLCVAGCEMVLKKLDMTLAISNIPILTGVAAETFVKNAEAAERSRGSIDFTQQHAE